MASPSLYPPSPTDVPADLTEPTAKYKTQIALVLLSLAFFFLLYFGILTCCLLFFLWTIGTFLLAPLAPSLAVVAFIQLALCLPVFLLFVYMVKNLFRFGG